MKSRVKDILETDWSYFEDDTRYGVLGVAGFETPDECGLGVTFAIVDLANCAREVVREYALGWREAKRMFARLVVTVDAMNSAEPE